MSFVWTTLKDHLIKNAYKLFESMLKAPLAHVGYMFFIVALPETRAWPAYCRNHAAIPAFTEPVKGENLLCKPPISLGTILCVAAFVLHVLFIRHQVCSDDDRILVAPEQVRPSTCPDLRIVLNLHLSGFFEYVEVRDQGSCYDCYRLAMEAFHFMECVQAWDSFVYLRHRARDLEVLVRDTRGKKNVLPTLKNIKYNLDALRPFSKIMAKYGFIYKNLPLLKPPLRQFYTEQLPEDQRRLPASEVKLTKRVNQSAFFIKRMLSMLKRKWAKGEMPRAP